jgi:hypothetical protein
MSKSKKELDELLALKKLNMLRLSNFDSQKNPIELEFANRLDNFLSKELSNNGLPMATYRSLHGLLINQNENTCDKSNYGEFYKFKSNKRMEGEREMLDGMNEIYEKEQELISELDIPDYSVSK